MTNRVLNISSLLRSFVGVSGVYMLSFPLLLLSNMILTRILSVSEFGAFGFAISLATLLAIPVSSGLSILISREVANYVQKSNFSAYRGLIIAAHSWVVCVSALVVFVAIVWRGISLNAGAHFLLLLSLVPLLGLSGIRNGILKGLGRPLLAEIPTQVLQPILLISGYLLLGFLGISTLINALWCYLISAAITFVAASLMLIKVQPATAGRVASDFQELPRWRAAILPFAMMGATAVLNTQVATFIAGILGHEEVVAYLRVAERGTMMIIMPFFVLNAVLGPHLVQAINSGSREEQRKVARHSARLMFCSAFPVAIFMLCFGSYVLRLLFGAPYDQFSYIPLCILATSQLISMSFGHSSMILNMSGRETLTLFSQLFALFVSIVVCLLLIGEYGVVGAALGVSAGIVTSTIINSALVKHFFGFFPGIF